MEGVKRRVGLVATGGFLLAGIAVSGVVVAGPVVAGAETSGGVQARLVHTANSFVPAYPVSNIKGQGRTAKYKPDALSVTEDTSGGNCGESGPPTSFGIANTGTKTAHITLNGGLLGNIPAGQSGTVCLYGGAAGDSLTFGLGNKAGTVEFAAKLTVTTTD
jgi:hypothetical protein